jgi:hypothetical protein
VLEADEHADLDRHDDLAKPKFTFTECVVALVLSLALVTLLAVFLVERIEDVVESGVPDQFLGLIMLPLVEKAAEHLTAIDEAWDGQIVCFTEPLQALLISAQNFALFHCIGPSIQTALFNAPLVVIISWIMGKDMDLNFEIFMIILLVLSILVVGNFLRDGESNYLEGALLVVSLSRLLSALIRLQDTKTSTDCVCHYCSRSLVLPEPRCCHIKRCRNRDKAGCEAIRIAIENTGQFEVTSYHGWHNMLIAHHVDNASQGLSYPKSLLLAHTSKMLEQQV